MFTKTLYFPYIDIDNEAWIKTAILYWDEISTIVPSSIKSPYSSGTSDVLAKERILRPFEVTPHMPEVREASTLAMRYLNSPEGNLVLTRGGGGWSRIHQDKMSRQLLSDLSERLSYLHRDKIEDELFYALSNGSCDDNGFILVDRNFTNYYMSILANRIAHNNGLSTAADSRVYNQFNLKLTKDIDETFSSRTYIRCPACRSLFNQLQKEQAKNTGRCPVCNEYIYHYRENGRNFYRPQADPRELVDGILTEIILDSFFIHPSVSVDKILRFREEHIDELKSFRGALQELTQIVTLAHDLDDLRSLRSHARGIYENVVKPKIKDLKSELKSLKIRYILSDFSISGAASVAGTYSGTGLSNYALVALAGISIGVSTMLYFNARNRVNSDRYAYLLSIENKLT